MPNVGEPVMETGFFYLCGKHAHIDRDCCVEMSIVDKFAIESSICYLCGKHASFDRDCCVDKPIVS